ncbi:hypothetical protein [Clostridium culturomicium]|uniref:hypothetical protein n=1 Tax=Clostridium culturomicium TaxID=1499683 RepID=UPI003857C876
MKKENKNIDRIYNPQFRFRFEQNNNIDVNSSLVEMIAGLGLGNFLEVVTLLKGVYGISYIHLSKVMNIRPSALRTAISHGYIDGIISEKKVVDGILTLQLLYLKDTFAQVEEVE